MENSLVRSRQEFLWHGWNLSFERNKCFAATFPPITKSVFLPFGFEFFDSYVMYHPKKGTIDFDRKNKSLANNSITNGTYKTERIQHIRTFTGQGFKIPKDATSILNLDASQTVYLTDTMWVFNDDVETFSANGLSQGAYLSYGQGKIAVFGEAAMFSAQLAGPKQRKVGMNSTEANENYKLALNIIRWLDGKLGE